MAASEHVNQHRLVPASRAPARLRPSSDGGARFTSTEYIPMIATDADEYEGPYEATPTRETQVFATERKLMVREFTVNPIPSNYGLITWNGQTLTVS